MSLGNRHARLHDTAATRKVAVNAEDWYDFKRGQNVMTADGFPGRVTAIYDGPVSGTEQYEVELHGGMGGGIYSAGQLTAHIDHEAAMENTAARDYPELAQVLMDRPDIGRYPEATMGMIASKTAVTGPMDNGSYCMQCGLHGVLNCGETVGKCDSCGNPRTDINIYRSGKYANKPERLCLDCLGSGHHMESAHDPEEVGDDTLVKMLHDRGQTPTWMRGKTAAKDDYDSVYDYPENHQCEDDGTGTCKECSQSMVHEAALVDGTMPPRHQAPGLCDNGHLSWGGQCMSCNEQNPNANAMVVNPGDHKPQDTEQIRNAAAREDWADPDDYGHLHYRGDMGNGTDRFGRQLCDRCGGHDHTTGEHDEEDEKDALAGKQSALEYALDIISSAASNSDLRFQITAAWRDVREKAQRIRSEAGVKVTYAEKGYIIATVRGDHGEYESVIMRNPGTQRVALWDCNCAWGHYNWNPDFGGKHAGRMCSHALALHYEAQTRGLIGRDDRISSTSAAHTVPLEALARFLVASGEATEEVAIVLQTLGSVNSPFGEPEANIPAALPGPTMPKDPSMNPGSAGPLTGADPTSWSQNQISGLDRMAGFERGDLVNHRDDQPGEGPYTVRSITEPWEHGDGKSRIMVSHPDDDYDWLGGPEYDPDEFRPHTSALDDEAIFEPEMRHSGAAAFALIPELLEGGAAAGEAAGAAEAGGEAAGAAEGGPRLPRMPHAPGGGGSGQGDNGSSSAPEEYQNANADAAMQDARNKLSTLHESPEAALPSTDGGPIQDAALEGDSMSDASDMSISAGLGDTAGYATGEGYMVPGNDSASSEGASVAPGMGIKDASDDALSPSNESIQPMGSIDSIVAEFQRTAGAQSLTGAGGSRESDASEIARMARQTLAKQAMAEFNPAQQAELINEGENVKAANLDRLDIEGTHYAQLEEALAAQDNDDDWMD